MIEPRPAATVMCLRPALDGIEVYMVRRSAQAAFMPDVYVYPGGAVDAEDDALGERLVGFVHPDISPRFVVAAIRESFEECGLFFGCALNRGRLAISPAMLDDARRDVLRGVRSFATVVHDLDVHLDAEALAYFSHWVTPNVETRRFDARFFVARAPLDQAAEADASETHDGRWIRPRDALAEQEAGRFAMMFPTIKHLERLAQFATVDAAMTFARSKPIVRVEPDFRRSTAFRLPGELEGQW